MATITRRKNSDGTTTYLAQVRIRPFKPTARAFPEKKAAAAWAGALEKTLREQRGRSAARPDVATLKVADLVREYLADPRTQALTTYSERERQLGWWVGQCGALRALELPTPLVIREARGRLLRKHEAGTVNRYLAAVRAVVNFGRGADLLPSSAIWPPCLMLPEPQHRERYLTDDELARALKAARAESELMYAAMMFAVGVGCRQGELLRVCWGDIDEASSTVAIRVTKSDTSRRAHLPPAVLQALKAWRGDKIHPLPGRLVFAHPDGAALANHYLVNRWEKIRVAAGLPSVRWHDLRHASASFLIQHGASLAEVAHQLGHKNPATSKKYAHLVPGVKPRGADELDKKLRG
jgi:integrase